MDSHDLVIIGGGVAGIGIADEAASQGLSVLLLEQGELLSGTSANSLRIIHGGYRYLQHLNFPRVLESIRAQQELLSEAADYVRPLECLMPLGRWGLKSRVPVQLSLYLFHVLRGSCGQRGKPGSLVTAGEVRRIAPLLAEQAPYGALRWCDATIDDLLGFHSWIVSRARERGAVLLENCRVSKVTSGQSELVTCYNCDGEERQVLSKCVVDVSGFMGQQLDLPFQSSMKASRPALWCRAFNLVFDYQLGSKYAHAIKGATGRLYFLVPRCGGAQIAIGTEYRPVTNNQNPCQVEEQDIRLFLEDLNKALPQLSLHRDRLVSTEVGLLPARARKGDTFSLYGSGEIEWIPIADSRGQRHPGVGIIKVMTTKYTTFRTQARRVVRLIK